MHKSRSEGSAFRVRVLAAAVASCFVSVVYANPTGGVPVAGAVSMDASIPGQLHVTNSPNSIIHWNSFSIGAGELTKFIQESASSAVLNRVVTPGSLSEILGTLQSNGRVFLINPNGITIGAGAVLDLPGFVASSLDMTDADFTAGRMRFQEVPGAGRVDNFGTIDTSLYPAGQVYLIGPAVGNGGVIRSPGGEVVLAAGNSVELMNAGTPGLSVALTAPANEVVNVGQVIADSGRVGIFGSIVTHGGVASADTAIAAADGSVRLVASDTADIAAGSSISALGGTLEVEAGTLRVEGDVRSGAQEIRVRNGVVVESSVGGFAQLSASGGQTIQAGYVEVNAGLGGGAVISNNGGDQSITATGANAAGVTLVVRGTDGGFARVAGANGTQTISLQGTGPNALVVGSPAGSGSAIISGDVQDILAGAAGENGSIALLGPLSQIISSPIPGGTQSVSTSGALSLVGSSTASSIFPAGIYAAGIGGQQKVRAASILLQGGSAPGGNAAMIVAVDGSQTIESGAGGITLAAGTSGTSNLAHIEQTAGNLSYTQSVTSAGPIVLRGGDAGAGNSALIRAAGGSQTVEAGPGGLTLVGGESGSTNFAQINQVATDTDASQTVVSAGPVHLQGGAGSLNFAMIRSFGGQQTLSLGQTSMLSGTGGIDNFTSIQGRVQDMVVHGDLTMTARGSAGSERIGGGSRIGGVGGNAPSPTELALTVEGNLTMTAGTLEGTGTLIGSFPHEATPNDIDLDVWGNLTLNGGTRPNTVSRIGAAQASNAGGTIAITAGEDIVLNSTAPNVGAVIRTADDVSLVANSITQGPDARIEASSLSTQTSQGASLVGANSVSELAMLNSASGNVAFNNASDRLNVTGIDQVAHGALALNQDGDLLINGDVTSGAQSISATGDMTITPGASPNVTVQAHGPQTFSAGGSFSLLGGTAWNGYARTVAGGPVSIATGEDLLVRGGSGVLAYALLYGGDGIRLTVGDELHVDGGSGPLAFARVQTDLWDKIYLDFPNRASGGYFVNGREGVTHQGLDGFFTGPARATRNLIVTYGE